MSRTNMFYWQADRPYTAKQIKDIFLDRKNDYDKDQISKAAALAFGVDDVNLKDPINFGSVNIVCPFTTNNGDQGVIRVHPGSVKNEYFYSEVEAMKLAAAAGIPVPNTILVDDTRNIFPFDYMVTSRVIGEVMQVAVEADPKKYDNYLKQIGRCLGKLHKIQTKKYGFFDNKLAKKRIFIGTLNSNKDHFLSALDLDEEFYDKNPGWFESDDIKNAINLLKAKADIAECDTPTLIHNDIADWNTIVKGDDVAGILDWDECISGDPVFEFATMSLFYTDEQMNIIKSGYVETNDLPSDYEKKFDLYVLRYIVNSQKFQ